MIWTPEVGSTVWVEQRHFSTLQKLSARKVARLTATLVVLDDGSRWRRDTRKLFAARDIWDTTSYELHDEDSARLPKIRREGALIDARRKARHAMNDWQRGETSTADLIETLTALAELEATPTEGETHE